MLALCTLNTLMLIISANTVVWGTIQYPSLKKVEDMFETLEIRKWFQHPNVELGPGAFKSELLTFPDDKVQKDLKKLLLLKKKMENDSRKKFRGGWNRNGQKMYYVLDAFLIPDNF
ncbi:hypothetical protein K1T71_009927 [Dendrolimus kikuchii]|uniref:Uncharacterized protein n=1 Tax=Dendrolimus kikuchii TaxID=765133 RepID=A0ACC1CTT1_9NEOP|nr:hypothetical protein K1T71_009927 [Dendrolimus kikuchii]